MIAFYSSAISYAQHLLPIALAYPDDICFHVIEHRGWQDARQWTHENIDPAIPVIFNHVPEPSTLTVIAAYTDLLTTRHLNPVLVEHGSGSSYPGCPCLQTGSYSGGPGRDDCRAFLVPNQQTADKNEAAYPSIPNHVVGSPWVETLQRIRAESRSQTMIPTVVISTHWDGINLCPELTSALPYFAPGLPAATSDPRWNLVGHCHPRARTFAEPIFSRAGIPFIADLRDVVRVADLYVIDNSSSALETAACGIPQLVLNSPEYRRDISHGPGSRFWDNILGPQVDDPPMLAYMIPRALEDPMSTERERIVEATYPPHDDSPTLRTVDALSSIHHAS